jgi:hypothetical protein
LSARISSLPVVVSANIADTDILPIVTGIASNTGVTKRVSITELRLKLGTTAPAGGRTVTSAATYLLNNAVFNVKDFGAFGDGTTDDTVAIQAAATAAVGGTLWFPKPSSRYKITAAINLSSNCVIKGEGWTEIWQATATTTHFTPGNDNEIAHLLLTGTGATSAPFFGRAAIYIDPVGSGTVGKRLFIHHVKFDASISITCIGGNNLTDVRIEQNYLVLSANAEHGIYSSGGGTRVRIHDNHIEKTASNGFATLGINVKGNSVIWITDNVIFGAGWDNGAIGLSTAASNKAYIRGNNIYGLPAGSNPITIANASADLDIIIDDNDIDGGNLGIYSKAARVTISRNRIRNTAFRAIEIDGTGALDAQKTTIRDNDIVDCNGGIRVVNADVDTYIIDNMTVGTTGTGIDYDSGSLVGLVAGNISRGHATGIRYGVAVPNWDNQSLGINYDEIGSWTPALKFGGASVGMTYSTQNGRYAKRGNYVRVTGSIALSAKGSSVGNATVAGIPFPVSGLAFTSPTYRRALRLHHHERHSAGVRTGWHLWWRRRATN